MSSNTSKKSRQKKLKKPVAAPESPKIKSNTSSKTPLAAIDHKSKSPTRRLTKEEKIEKFLAETTVDSNEFDLNSIETTLGQLLVDSDESQPSQAQAALLHKEATEEKTKHNKKGKHKDSKKKINEQAPDAEQKGGVEHKTTSRKREKDVVFIEPDIELNGVEEYLAWCNQHKYIRVTSMPVPQPIVDSRQWNITSITLHDISVFRRGPDDWVFENFPLVWQRVARGNTVVEIESNGKKQFMFALQGMRKFTGKDQFDDDDKMDLIKEEAASNTNTKSHQPKKDADTWKKFFLSSVDHMRKIIVTEKANGEAALLSAIRIQKEVFFLAGSKNVRQLFATKDDVREYPSNETRYKNSTPIAMSVMHLLEDMDKEQREEFVNYLLDKKATANFEVILPDYQHVVQYKIKHPLLNFLCFTTPSFKPPMDLCLMPPHKGFRFAERLGLKTVEYSVKTMEDLNEIIDNVRNQVNTEGAVLYVLDEDGKTLGLWKIKSIWYIIIRAVREKVRRQKLRQNPTTAQ